MSNQLSHHEIANALALQELQQKIILMRQLHTPKGFYAYWFSQIPKHPTRLDCFNAANSLYEELFGTPRYSTYNSFAKLHKK